MKDDFKEKDPAAVVPDTETGTAADVEELMKKSDCLIMATAIQTGRTPNATISVRESI